MKSQLCFSKPMGREKKPLLQLHGEGCQSQDHEGSSLSYVLCGEGWVLGIESRASHMVNKHSITDSSTCTSCSFLLGAFGFPGIHVPSFHIKGNHLEAGISLSDQKTPSRPCKPKAIFKGIFFITLIITVH